MGSLPRPVIATTTVVDPHGSEVESAPRLEEGEKGSPAEEGQCGNRKKERQRDPHDESLFGVVEMTEGRDGPRTRPSVSASRLSLEGSQRWPPGVSMRMCTR